MSRLRGSVHRSVGISELAEFGKPCLRLAPEVQSGVEPLVGQSVVLGEVVASGQLAMVEDVATDYGNPVMLVPGERQGCDWFRDGEPESRNREIDVEGGALL